MMIDETSAYTAFQALILTLPRITLVLWLLPFLDDTVFTRTIRTSVALSLGLIVFPLVFSQVPDRPFDIIILFGLFIKEIFIGGFFGFTIALIFWAVSTSGFILDMQRGAFVASLFSPVFKDQVSPIGGLLLQGLAVLFFISGGILLALSVVYKSYEVWPVLTFYPEITPLMGSYLAEYFEWMIKIALIVAAPMVVVMLLIDFSMGLINKFVPQLQVFFLSMPIKGLMAVFILILFLPRLLSFLQIKVTSEMHTMLTAVLAILQ